MGLPGPAGPIGSQGGPAVQGPKETWGIPVHPVCLAHPDRKVPEDPKDRPESMALKATLAAPDPQDREDRPDPSDLMAPKACAAIWDPKVILAVRVHKVPRAMPDQPDHQAPADQSVLKVTLAPWDHEGKWVLKDFRAQQELPASKAT